MFDPGRGSVVATAAAADFCSPPLVIDLPASVVPVGTRIPSRLLQAPASLVRIAASTVIARAATASGFV
jgi:hypothetical protein